MLEASGFASIDRQPLTAGSVLVAASGLAYTWHNDQLLRRHEAANRIRAAAAATIAGLDLWVELALGLFDNLQEVFVKMSEDLLDQQDVPGTHDRLWAELNRVHSEIVGARPREKLQSGVRSLYGYGRDSYARFKDTMIGLKSQEAAFFERLLDATQEDVRAGRANWRPTSQLSWATGSGTLPPASQRRWRGHWKRCSPQCRDFS